MFKLTELPYPTDALAPVISADTMATHHGKHHAAYVKKTNELLEKAGKTPSSLEDVVREAKSADNKPLFNNSAQAWNHGFFWECLTPEKTTRDAALAEAVKASFGGDDQFRKAFVEAGAAHFASGWIWLTLNAEGALAFSTMPNAETPITDGKTPVLVCDLWEHAYYLDYKNERPRFLETVFDQRLNWAFASRQYDAAKQGNAGWTYPAPA